MQQRRQARYWKYWCFYATPFVVAGFTGWAGRANLEWLWAHGFHGVVRLASLISQDWPFVALLSPVLVAIGAFGMAESDGHNATVEDARAARAVHLEMTALVAIGWLSTFGVVFMLKAPAFAMAPVGVAIAAYAVATRCAAVVQGFVRGRGGRGLPPVAVVGLLSCGSILLVSSPVLLVLVQLCMASALRGVQSSSR